MLHLYQLLLHVSICNFVVVKSFRDQSFHRLFLMSVFFSSWPLQFQIIPFPQAVGIRFRKWCKLWKLEGIWASPLTIATLWRFAHLKSIFPLLMSRTSEWNIWYFMTWSNFLTMCTQSTSGAAEVLTFVSECFWISSWLEGIALSLPSYITFKQTVMALKTDL